MSLSKILLIGFTLMLVNHLVGSTFLASMILKNRQEKVLNRFLNEIRELDINPVTSKSTNVRNEPQREQSSGSSAYTAGGGAWKANPVELKVKCELGTHETGSRVSLCCKNPLLFADKANENAVNCKSLTGELERPSRDLSVQMDTGPGSKDLSQALSNFIKLVEELDSKGRFRQNKT